MKLTTKSLLAIIWAAAFIGEFLVPYVLSMFVKNYSHLKTVMSALGAEKSAVGKIYSGWLVIFGLLCIVYSFLFVKINADPAAKGVITGAVFIALYGIGSGVICGLFPVDETREMVSVSAKIHGGSVVLAFFLLMFLPLVLRKYAAELAGVSGSVISYLAFALCICWFVFQILSEKEGFMHTWLGYTGLWQRLYLFSIYAYIAVITYWTVRAR